MALFDIKAVQEEAEKEVAEEAVKEAKAKIKLKLHAQIISLAA